MFNNNIYQIMFRKRLTYGLVVAISTPIIYSYGKYQWNENIKDFECEGYEKGIVYNGKQFKEKYGEKMYKVIRKDLTHNDFTYQIGKENVDHRSFYPYGECNGGGLYFTNKKNILEFSDYGDKIYLITIPDDAQVYVESRKAKASKFIVVEEVGLEELYGSFWEKYKLKNIIKKTPFEIRFMKNQNDKLCLLAIRQDNRVFKYIKNQTPEICLAAVQENGSALEYVQNQTPEICLAAVQENGNALKYVKNQTPEICLAAIRQNCYALQYVINQTPEICLAAVQQNGCVLNYVQNQTPEICLTAVRTDGNALQYGINQTPEICLAAVQQNGRTLKYVENQTSEICLAAVQQNGDALQYVQNQTLEICLAAVQADRSAIQYVRNEFEQICEGILKK